MWTDCRFWQKRLFSGQQRARIQMKRFTSSQISQEEAYLSLSLSLVSSGLPPNCLLTSFKQQHLIRNRDDALQNTFIFNIEFNRHSESMIVVPRRHCSHFRASPGLFRWFHTALPPAACTSDVTLIHFFYLML